MNMSEKFNNFFLFLIVFGAFVIAFSLVARLVTTSSNAGTFCGKPTLVAETLTLITEYHTAMEVAKQTKQQKVPFTLLAYCPCYLCCGNSTGFTASGTIPKQGRTVASDWNVIPPNTAIIINGHTYIVEDRGGGIRGNMIDIFFNCHYEALRFGRQKAYVEILQ